MPVAGDDPGWTVVDVAVPGRGAAAALAREAVFTIGDGSLATRGALEEDPAAAAVLASGVYSGTGAAEHLLVGPSWTGLDLTGSVEAHRRVLDLRTGVLSREASTGSTPLRIARFASPARPGLQVLRAQGPSALFSPGAALRPPVEGRIETGRYDGVDWVRTRGDDASGDRGGIVAVAVQAEHVVDGRRTVDRFAVYRADPVRTPDPQEAIAALRSAQQAGFEVLLAEQREAWADRWAHADVEIPDDPSAELAFRFALFQLWVNAGCTDEAPAAERAVGARGLSGTGYAGHVFWDADVFVLPALATICPAAARAMLEYRIRRLPQARAAALACGRAGARFPWESARDGIEVTPTSMLLGDEMIAVRTGELEEHIGADVAWAADHYAAWTGDHELAAGPGRAMIVETARYWASRIRLSPDGRGHIDGVIGPDEYHEDVDDDAFTNVMARWNLRRGAELVADPAEAAGWLALADALVDGYDPATGRHEQFAGYDVLEPLLAADVAQIPFAADLVLPRERVARSQLIKQPDVLMAHFVVPQELPAGSLSADLDFYVPRTSHGSSLSPAITAALQARAGRADEALDMLRLALRMDLDDVTGSSAKGLHVATIGGLWQALVYGVLGLTVASGTLQLDPQLPSAWGSVRIRLRCLGARVVVQVGPERLTVDTDRPLLVRPAGAQPVRVRDRAQFVRATAGWQPV